MSQCCKKARHIAGGKGVWKDVLRDFWDPFEELVKQTSDISITEVIDKLDPLIGRHFFPVQASIPTGFAEFVLP